MEISFKFETFKKNMIDSFDMNQQQYITLTEILPSDALPMLWRAAYNDMDHSYPHIGGLSSLRLNLGG